MSDTESGDSIHDNMGSCKQVRNPQECKKTKIKQARLAGEQYTNHKRNLIAAKKNLDFLAAK